MNDRLAAGTHAAIDVHVLLIESRAYLSGSNLPACYVSPRCTARSPMSCTPCWEKETKYYSFSVPTRAEMFLNVFIRQQRSRKLKHKNKKYNKHNLTNSITNIRGIKITIIMYKYLCCYQKITIKVSYNNNVSLQNAFSVVGLSNFTSNLLLCFSIIR